MKSNANHKCPPAGGRSRNLLLSGPSHSEEKFETGHWFLCGREFNPSATPSILLLFISLALISTAPAQSTSIFQDFTADFPRNLPDDVTAINDGTHLGPEVVDDGWDGKALRLTEDVPGLNNGVMWIDPIDSAHEKLTVSIDFKIDSQTNDLADGIGFTLLNVDHYSIEEVKLAPGEEPNYQGSVGVGFDIWDNSGEGGNSISVHFDGIVIESLPIDLSPVPSIETGQPIHTETVIDFHFGGGASVSVMLNDGTNSTLFGMEIPLVTPYDYHFMLTGRTGGQSAGQFIDNVNVFSFQSGTGTRQISEDSEGVSPSDPVPTGGTPFTTVPNGTDPGPTLLPHTPGATGNEVDGYVRLAAETVNQNNIVIFDESTVPVGPDDRIELQFNFRGTDTDGSSADGLGVILFDSEIRISTVSSISAI